MSRLHSMLTRLRRPALAAATALVVVKAGWHVFINQSSTMRDRAGRVEWFEQMAERLTPARQRLSTDRVYRLIFSWDVANSAAYAFDKGLVEYIFAPVVVDATSDSPWVVVESGGERPLDTWLAQQEDFALVERFGGGVALLRDARR